MEQAKQNKEFIIRYYNAVSGVIKTKELLDKFITDEHLLNHIVFFDSGFPKYEMFADEMTAEDNRVVVRARAKGVHEGEFNGILPTHRAIEVHSMITYVFENGKIIHHTLIADQMELMAQLGVMNMPAGE